MLFVKIRCYVTGGCELYFMKVLGILKRDCFLYHIYWLPDISFMRFRALPALNQAICCSFKVWFNLIFSTLLSVLTSQSTGLPGAKPAKSSREILLVGCIYKFSQIINSTVNIYVILLCAI